MTDSHSHTDDQADNRTPPPGVEVIGELPPGTPWWDAEKLGFLVARSNLMVLVVSCFGVSLLVLSRIDFQPEGDGVFQFRAGLAYAAFVLLAAAAWIALLWRKIAIQISVNELVRRAPPLGDLSVPRRVNLAKAINPEIFESYDRGEAYCNGIKFNILPGDEYDPPAVLGAFFLRADGTVIHRLLTYRIAKAKGENPPPPDFS